jgi:UDPglucose 6-dehydrogenase
MKSLYKPLPNGHPVIFMDIISAEMTKYAANSMLAAKISFINDIANLVKSLVLTLIKFEKELMTLVLVTNLYIQVLDTVVLVSQTFKH